MSQSALRRGRWSAPNHAYVITTVTTRRIRFFVDFDIARVVIAEMRRLHNAGDVDSLAWVLMPDHVHWLFILRDFANLSTVMKKFKSRSAIAVNRRLDRYSAVWQRGYYDHAIRVDEELRTVGRYIVANPLRAHLVNKLVDYPHWDAVWL
jgi:putative transposase